MSKAQELADKITSYERFGDETEDQAKRRLIQQNKDAAAELRRLDRVNAEQRVALEKIARWIGEFPATGRFHDNGEPQSYGFCFGSNGERDYMRSIARSALSSTGGNES